MKPIAKQAIIDAYEDLTNATAAVTGCAMFAPDHLRKRDLPGLVEAMVEAEGELLAALEAAGIWTEEGVG